MSQWWSLKRKNLLKGMMIRKMKKNRIQMMEKMSKSLRMALKMGLRRQGLVRTPLLSQNRNR